MQTLKFLFVLGNLLALFIALSSAETKQDNNVVNAEEAQRLRGPSPFFGRMKHAPYGPVKSYGNPRAQITCDKFPRVCHVKGSPGHDCCNKRCVNVKTDNLNCGMCGLKCRYPEICCNGRCVNPLHDRKHCGGCHNKCKSGSVCYYGMCSYA